MVGRCRDLARSNESVDSRYVSGETIESWVSRKDKFRVTAKGHPMCLPLWSKSNNPELDRIFETKVRYPSLYPILESHGITRTIDYLHYLFPQHDESAGIETLTIKVIDEDSTSWKQAAREVRRTFLDAGAGLVVSDIQVEIQNVDKCYWDVSKPLPNDERLLGSLATVRMDVLDIVKSRLPGIWASVAYHLRVPRLSNEPRKPTIIIFCSPGSSADFTDVEEQVIQALNDIPFDIYVELLPGTVYPVHTSEPIFMAHIAAEPQTGDSISIEGKTNDAGSLGGWVNLNLRQPSRQVKCALTCYSIVKPGDESVAEHTNKNGVVPDDVRGQVNVEYPAAYDSMFSKARFEMWPHDQAAEKLEILTSRLSNPCIGKVILASGYRKNKDNQRLDWALIENPDTFSPNKPPPESSLVGGFVDLPSDDLYLQNQDPVVREVSGVQAGDWVIKRGRSTGVTSGFINGMKRDINWLSLGFSSEEWEILTN